jgi:Tfp pilus assembly protein PilF
MQPSKHTLILPLLLAACSSPPTGSLSPQTRGDDTLQEAREALDRGDLRSAHALLSEQLITESLIEINSLIHGGELELAHSQAVELSAKAPLDQRARDAQRDAALWLSELRLSEAFELHSQGNLRDALSLLDQVVKLSPENIDARVLRGELALALGQELGDPFFFEDALKEFKIAAQSEGRLSAWTGASRAARFLYYDRFDRSQIEDAVLSAREAVRIVEEDGTDLDLLELLPSQVHAEASFDLYRAARQTDDKETAANAAVETRIALEKCIATRPELTWAWLQLAALLEWESAHAEARDVLRNALSLAPNDPALHTEHARLSRAIGGYEEVVSAYAHFLKEHPDSPLGSWYYAVDSFELALSALNADLDAREQFRAAEEAFTICRTQEASYGESCLGYEAMCRAGAGLAMFKAGDVAAAQRSFLSMEELFKGGLSWKIEGRMLSGLAYLDYVVGHHYQRQLDEKLPAKERLASLLEAATLASFLHGYAPGDGRRANDAGFLNRDAGVELEREARRVLRASLIEANSKELGERSSSLYSLARGHMNASADAYAVAAMLLPNDARVVNDTGLILTYYLQRDLEQATQYHMLAIKTGRAQLEAVAAGTAEENKDTVTAVGDAYQNLGYLDLTLRGASGSAREWFKQCVAFDPVGREMIHQVLAPLCDLLDSGRISPEEVRALYKWGIEDADSLLAKDSIFARIEAMKAEALKAEAVETTLQNTDAAETATATDTTEDPAPPSGTDTEED